MKSVIVLAIIISSLVSLSKTETITIDLHHPDLSSTSPLYNPSLSHFQRVAIALQRLSLANLHRRRNLQQTNPVATIQNTNGNYLVNFSIGTPPVNVQGTFDTGSDLIWAPCNKLIAEKSKSLTNISCNSPICKSLPERSDPNCTTADVSRCSYDLSYADGSSNKGSLSTETITLGSAVFPNIAFGCATNYSGSNGSLGLGGGPVSLIRQLIALGNIKPLFSYCLVSIDSDRSTSTLHLGDTAAADVSPDDAIPLVQDSERPTFYIVNLGSITVGNDQKAVTFSKNVIFDTGTGSSRLPISFYNSLLGELMRSFGTKNVSNDVFDLCYTSLPAIFPDITLRFGAVAVKWKQENVFAQLDLNLWCVPAFPIGDDEEAILGNIAQVNFLVGFNLQANIVTFQTKDCSSSN